MLVEAFDFSLKHPCQRGLVVMAKFDGVHPALACATTGGKVLLHQPFQPVNTAQSAFPSLNKASGSSKYLNSNKEIVAMCAGRLDPQNPNEYLFIASKTNLLCYDVENNKDVFDKEVTDGINCLTIGAFGASGGASTLEESNMVVAGGNCSLNGFDIVGEEKFWTVTGDNVGALTFMDWDGDGQEELLVGSDDQSIRVFKGEELLHDIQEMSKLSFLTRFGLHRGVFGYALNNGAYGVYHGKKRLWRQKSKDRVTALLGLEFDIDGQLILAVGFASGAVLVRKHRTGDLIHEAKMSGGIVGMFFVDYRQEGTPQLVVVDSEGEVKGFQLTRNIKQFQAITEVEGVAAHKIAEDQVIQLNQKRIDLLNKIEVLKKKKEQRLLQAKQAPQSYRNLSQMPPSRKDLQITQQADPSQGTTVLSFTLNKPGWIIKSVVIFNEILFEGESLAIQPQQSTNQVQVPLRSEKNQELYLDIHVMVGAGVNSSQFIVFKEPRFVFKKFSMLRYLSQDQKLLQEAPKGQVSYQLDNGVKIPDLARWAERAFLLDQQQLSIINQIANQNYNLTLRFLDIRTSKPLLFQAQVHSGSCLQITFHTDSLELAGDLVQDLFGSFLKLPELDCSSSSSSTIIGSGATSSDQSTGCSFPSEMSRLGELLGDIEQHNQLKTHFATNIAESINTLKLFIVKAEAALMINDVDAMKKSYAVVQQENGGLIGEYLKRANNHQDLVSTLKELNGMIRNASNLRLGQAQKRVVAHARECIKNNWNAKIQHVFERGSIPG